MAGNEKERNSTASSHAWQQVFELLRGINFGEICILFKDGEPVLVKHMKKSIQIQKNTDTPNKRAATRKTSPLLSSEWSQVFKLSRGISDGELCIVIKDGEPIRVENISKDIELRA